MLKLYGLWNNEAFTACDIYLVTAQFLACKFFSVVPLYRIVCSICSKNKLLQAPILEHARNKVTQEMTVTQVFIGQFLIVNASTFSLFAHIALDPMLRVCIW